MSTITNQPTNQLLPIQCLVTNLLLPILIQSLILNHYLLYSTLLCSTHFLIPNHYTLLIQSFVTNPHLLQSPTTNHRLLSIPKSCHYSPTTTISNSYQSPTTAITTTTTTTIIISHQYLLPITSYSQFNILSLIIIYCNHLLSTTNHSQFNILSLIIVYPNHPLPTTNSTPPTTTPTPSSITISNYPLLPSTIKTCL